MTTETDTIETAEVETQPEIKYTQEDFKKIASEKKAISDKSKQIEKDLIELQTEMKQIKDEKLKASGDIQAVLTAKEKELLDLQSKVSESEKYKVDYETLQDEIKKELLEKLDKEHKAFAQDLPMTKLREYVKLHQSEKVPTDNSSNKFKNKNESEDAMLGIYK